MDDLKHLLKTDDFATQLSDEYFKAQHKPLLNIYVDMSTIFDYKLTALLGMIKTSVEYEYIVSRLELYYTYKGRKITTCFPALKFTEEQVIAFMKDPKNVDHMSFGGIITNISNLLPTQISMFDMVNKNSPMFKNEIINVYFANEFFMPSEASCMGIRNSICRMFPNVNCEFRNVQINKEPANFLKKMDHFIIDNIETFTEQGSTTFKLMMEERSFKNIMIYATYMLDEEAPFLKDDGEERLKTSEEVYSLFCFFMFFNKRNLDVPTAEEETK